MTEKQMSLIKTWLHEKMTEEITPDNVAPVVPLSVIKPWLHEKITEEITGSNELADLSPKDYEDFVKDLPDDDTELLRYVMFG